MGLIYLTEQQFSNRAKTIETQNLKKYKKTPHWLTILSTLRESVIEYQDGIAVVNEVAYKEKRDLCKSESYCKVSFV